jgi:hypothetical protein
MVMVRVFVGLFEIEAAVPHIDFPCQTTGDQMFEDSINGGKTHLLPSCGLTVQVFCGYVAGPIKENIQKALSLGRPTEIFGGKVFFKLFGCLGVGRHKASMDVDNNDNHYH